MSARPHSFRPSALLASLAAILLLLPLLAAAARAQRPPAERGELEFDLSNPFYGEEIELILWNPPPGAQCAFYLAPAEAVHDWAAERGTLPNLDQLNAALMVNNEVHRADALGLPLRCRFPLNDPGLIGQKFCAQAVVFDEARDEVLHTRRLFSTVHGRGLVVPNAGHASAGDDPSVRVFERRLGGWELVTELPVSAPVEQVVFSGDLSRAFALIDPDRGLIEVVDCDSRERRQLPPLGPGIVRMVAADNGARLVVLARQMAADDSFRPAGRVYVLDGTSGEVLEEFPVGPVVARDGRGFAIDPRRGTAWVAVDGFAVHGVDLTTGANTFVGVAGTADAAIADLQVVDDFVVVLCRGRDGEDSSTLHWYRPGGQRPWGQAEYGCRVLPEEALAMNVGPSAGGRRALYLLNRQGDRVQVVDVVTHELRSPIRIPPGAAEMAVAAGQQLLVFLYPGVPSRDFLSPGGVGRERPGGWLRVVDLRTGELVKEIYIGLSRQRGLAVVRSAGAEEAAFLIPATGRCRLVDLTSLDETQLLVGFRPGSLLLR
ncbi:MAG: hypothetical protein AB1486_08710 [Planctomycetota bacterium]